MVLKFLKKNLFLQVIIAVLLGIVVGVLVPSIAVELKVIALVYIRFIKLVIAPIIFISIILGVCSHRQHQSRIGVLAVRTLIYLEIMSVVAILITFAYMLLFKPGNGFDTSAFHNTIASFKVKALEETNFKDFVISMIPDNATATLANDNLLAVIVLAVIFAIAILHIKDNRKILGFFNQANEIFFQIIGMVIKFSPFAAFGAIAATVGDSGVKSLTMLLYFIFVLGISMVTIWILLAIVARCYGFSFIKLMKHIKEELFIAFGTSSSESVFPQLMQKLESFGCAKKIVGFVLPTGYAFNLVGTGMYVTAGAFFIQQAYHVPLTFSTICIVIGTILVLSKGAAGVAGAGFITLSAVLAALPQHMIPLEGLALLLGIDRFMSDARTVTNIIGNTVGTVIIAKAENEFTPNAISS